MKDLKTIEKNILIAHDALKTTSTAVAIGVFGTMAASHMSIAGDALNKAGAAVCLVGFAVLATSYAAGIYFERKYVSGQMSIIKSYGNPTEVERAHIATKKTNKINNAIQAIKVGAAVGATTLSGLCVANGQLGLAFLASGATISLTCGALSLVDTDQARKDRSSAQAVRKNLVNIITSRRRLPVNHPIPNINAKKSM